MSNVVTNRSLNASEPVSAAVNRSLSTDFRESWIGLLRNITGLLGLMAWKKLNICVSAKEDPWNKSCLEQTLTPLGLDKRLVNWMQSLVNVNIISIFLGGQLCWAHGEILPGTFPEFFSPSHVIIMCVGLIICDYAVIYFKCKYARPKAILTDHIAHAIAKQSGATVCLEVWKGSFQWFFTFFKVA